MPQIESQKTKNERQATRTISNGYSTLESRTLILSLLACNCCIYEWIANRSRKPSPTNPPPQANPLNLGWLPILPELEAQTVTFEE